MIALQVAALQVLDSLLLKCRQLTDGQRLLAVLLEQQDLAELMYDVLYTNHLPLLEYLRLPVQLAFSRLNLLRALFSGGKQVGTALSSSPVALSELLPPSMRHPGRRTSVESHPSPGGEQRQRSGWRTHRSLRRPPPQRHVVQVNIISHFL